MELFFLIVYMAIFILQIVLLVLSIRKKDKKYWMLLFLTELVSTCIAYVLMRYYDNLLGYGFMPGFTYMGEVLFSFGATVLYGVFFLISVISYIMIVKNRDRTCN